MQSCSKNREYYDRKAKSAPLKQNDYCFILQPIADHQGSKIPFREYRWTGPYIVERVLPNENNVVRKLNSNEILIPQDDLYVITWETTFGEVPNSTEEVPIPTRLDATDTSHGLVDDARPPGEIFTDVDLRSTGRHEKDNSELLDQTRSERTNDWLDDQQSSGGSDTIVPEVLDD